MVQYSDLMPFTKALHAILAVLLFHIILLFSDGYFLILGIDAPMHFAGGFAMGMLGLAIHNAVSHNWKQVHIPWWYVYLFVIGFTMTIAVAWEIHEFVLDRTLVHLIDWQIAQVSLSDTMSDLALGFLGGSAAFTIFRKIRT